MSVRLLTIAGFDSSGCAGIAADLRTFRALDAHGAAAVTAVTAQDTERVLAIEPVTGALIEKQIEAVARDVGIDAVKVGLLPTESVVAAVARVLEKTGARPVVVDPVLQSSGGAALTAAAVGPALVGELAPVADVWTPNLPELEALTGTAARGDAQIDEAAALLIERTGGAVIVTGGHLDHPDRVEDIVYQAAGREVVTGERVALGFSRGTGCVHSSALAVGLARGLELVEAARLAQETVRRGLEGGYNVGRARVLAP